MGIGRRPSDSTDRPIDRIFGAGGGSNFSGGAGRGGAPCLAIFIANNYPVRLGLGWRAPRPRGKRRGPLTVPAPMPAQRGTSRSYLLRRLRRAGRPDLVAAIEDGRVSAYAVAVALGWQTRQNC